MNFLCFLSFLSIRGSQRPSNVFRRFGRR